MSSGMNTEQAKEYAKMMTYRQAIGNVGSGKFIKYRKATMIKLRELAEIADKLDRKTEPQTIRCPKCGRNDYIREFGRDFSVTAEEAGFKYKCINCNTYIEPQTEEGER